MTAATRDPARSPAASAPRSPASTSPAPLDGESVAAIRAALNEHKALVFREPDLDDEGQQRFARHFGELTTAHPTVPAVDGRRTCCPWTASAAAANHWHTDVTFVLTRRRPPPCAASSSRRTAARR